AASRREASEGVEAVDDTAEVQVEEAASQKGRRAALIDAELGHVTLEASGGDHPQHLVEMHQHVRVAASVRLHKAGADQAVESSVSEAVVGRAVRQYPGGDATVAG